MVACGGRRHIAPLILKLVTVWSVSSQQHAVTALPPTKNPLYPEQCGQFEKRKICLFRDLNRRSASP